MKTVNLVKAYHFDVFCEMNDMVDVKCGGPLTLGYDFFVNAEKKGNKEKFKSLIENLLKKYNRKYESINVRLIKEYREDRLWDEDKIEKCIKKTYPV